MAETKPCPILVASPNGDSTLCLRNHCMWWCESAEDCSITFIADFIANSNICRNIGERRADNG